VHSLAEIVRLSANAQAQIANHDRQARRISAATNTGGRSHGGQSVASRGHGGQDTSGRGFVPSHSGRNNNNNFVPHEVWSILTPTQRITISRDRREGEQASVQGSSHGGYGRGGRSYFDNQSWFGRSPCIGHLQSRGLHGEN
jgi:hypothetical protein